MAVSTVLGAGVVLLFRTTHYRAQLPRCTVDRQKSPTRGFDGPLVEGPSCASLSALALIAFRAHADEQYL